MLACPSVLVTIRSACGLSTSESVAELLPATGSVAPGATVDDAGLSSVPRAVGTIAAVTEYVTEPPTGMSTMSAMFPDPAAVHVAPPAATHDHVAPVRIGGRTSVIELATASDGPAFVATIE